MNEYIIYCNNQCNNRGIGVGVDERDDGEWMIRGGLVYRELAAHPTWIHDISWHCTLLVENMVQSSK